MVFEHPITAAPLVPEGISTLPGPEPLQGTYVLLERLAPSHFADLYANVGSHPSLWTWWPDGPFPTAERFTEYMHEFLSYRPEDLAVYSVFLTASESEGKQAKDGKEGKEVKEGKEKKEAIGLAMALSEDRTTNRVGEIGMFYGPQLQRTRAGTEVVYLLMKMLFEGNHRRVQWKTNALNAPSCRAAVRYGFLHEATLRQHAVQKGRNRDAAWFAIIDGEWEVAKRAFEIWLGEGNFDGEGRQRRRLEEVRREVAGKAKES